MCQAYDGEANGIRWHEKCVRERGYQAFLSGVPYEDNPEQAHPNPEYCDKKQWWLGWETAKEGKKLW